MRLNRTSVWKLMTIWISRDLPLFNFECLNTLCAWIKPTCEADMRGKCYDHLNCSRVSVVQFQAFRFIMRLNLTFVWKVMTIWISWELPCWISSVSICAALESDIRLKSYDHLKFSRASVVQFRASWYIMFPNHTSKWKFFTFWISRELLLFNSEHSIYYVPESHIWVKSYDYLNFPRASVAQFRASWYLMRLNRTSVWKVMTIWISRELPLFNFERLDMWSIWIGCLS